MLMLTMEFMDMDWVTMDWVTELMDMDTLMPATATTARDLLMLNQKLMLTMDIMDMDLVTTDWVTELMDMDTDTLMLTTMATTTARDPLMLSPRSLATPVSSEVSTAEPTLDS